MHVELDAPRRLWVIGHRVTIVPVGGRAALLEVVTPPGVPGPPPHHHEHEDECFYVVEGRLGVMVDGTWSSLGAGEWAQVPRGAVHTFRNEGEGDVRTITAFEPHGFERFFLEFGIDAAEPDAFERSVAEESIARVVDGCGRLGMILAPEPAATRS